MKRIQALIMAAREVSHRSLLCKRVVMLAVAICAFSAVAAEFTIKAGSPDWSLPSSYNEGSAPSAGDTVTIPNNASVTVSDTNLASYETFANLALVKMGGKDSELIVDVQSTDVVRTNACCVYYNTSRADYGKLVKTGPGTAAFTYVVNGFVLYLPLDIRQGTLELPQEYAGGQHCYVGSVHVAEGAVLVTAKPVGDVSSLSRGTTTIKGELTGAGLITNRIADAFQRMIVSGGGRFDGVIAVGRLTADGGKTFEVTCDHNMQGESGVTGGAVFGASDFGLTTDPCSPLGIGSSEMTFFGSGAFRYIGGVPSTTDRNFQTRDASDGIMWIDAGTNGELTVSGKVYSHRGDSDRYLGRIGFRGTGKPSVFSGYLTDGVVSDEHHPFHLTKDGSCTWRMLENANTTWSGALTVLDGTLEFDTLADAGTLCALGYGTNLYRDIYAVAADSDRVDWAWRLGGTETCGTLAYVGTSGGWSTNRAAVVDVGGGKIANESSAELGVFGGIRPASTAATLTIGGSSTGYSVIGDVQGDLSLVKEDSGTWILDSGNTFSGKLEVKEGTLYVRDTTKYSWYKFVFKERQSGKADAENIYACEELGFYDQDNVRVNGGLRPYTNYSAVAENRLPPGFCGFQNQGSGPGYDKNWDGKIYPVEAMFDDGTPLLTVNETSTYLRRYDMSKTDYVIVDPHDPDTWSTVNMHFPFGSKVVASFDLCQVARVWNYNREVKGFSIEASVDGRRWDVLTNVTLTISTGSAYSPKWAFEKSEYTAGSAGTHTGGAPIAGRPASSVKALSNVSAVSVAKGARLIGENADVEIKGLEVDGRGAGTIENCTFAQTGSIVVKNSKEATGGMLELEFVNCGSPERIANWTAVVDGKTRCKIAYRNGKLRVVRPGLFLVVR